MTLILAAEGPQYLLVSDILLTREGLYMDPVKGLPIRPHSLVIHSGNISISGMAQKTIVIDAHHAIQWSGSRVVAHGLIKSIASSIQSSSEQSFASITRSAGFSEEELDEVSLIYHYINSGGALTIETMNAETKSLEGRKCISAGSGAFNFIHDVQVEGVPPSNYSGLDFLRPWLHRIGHALVSEALDGENFSYAYGGWFELAMATPLCFAKMPYLVKYWKKLRSGELTSGPCLTSWYDDHHLCIATAAMKKNEQDSQFFGTIVRDPLNRTEPKQTWEDLCETYSPPGFQFHLIHDEDGHFGILPCGVDAAGFDFSFSSTNVHMAWSSELKATLENALYRAPGRITRPYTGEA